MLHENVMLGKGPVRVDPRTLKMVDYVSKLAPAPLVYDVPSALGSTYNFGMMGNDKLGDCTIAGKGHTIQMWTFRAKGAMVTLPDSAIILDYEKFGYNPVDPNTDQGAVELDVLNDWVKNPLAGHALKAFVSIHPHSAQQTMDAIYYFGASYIGLALPLFAQNEDVWSVPRILGSNGVPGSWGGHCVTLVAHNKIGPICITWGKLKQMTWNFYFKYCDEAYALLSTDWLNNSMLSPAGFDINALEQDLTLVRAA